MNNVTHNKPSPCPACGGVRAHGRPYCAPCRNAYIRAQRIMGKREHLDGNTAVIKRRKDAKTEALALKGGKCNRCGWTTDNPLHFGVFHFHHPERDRTLRNMGFGQRGAAAWIKEIERCELLCSNCHIMEHAAEPGNRPGRPKKPIDQRTQYWLDRMQAPPLKLN